MARRKASRATIAARTDDFDAFENELLGRVRPVPPLQHRRAAVRLSPALEDLRRWAPTGREPVREATGRPARIVHKVASRRTVERPRGSGFSSVRRMSARKFLPEVPSFAAPGRVMICLKRKIRREVLFAFKRTGKGARSKKRRNEWSDVRC